MEGTWIDLKGRGDSRLGQLLQYLLAAVVKRLQRVYRKKLPSRPRPVAGLFVDGELVGNANFGVELLDIHCVPVPFSPCRYRL